MIHRAFLHLARTAARTPRFAFSQQSKPTQDQQPKTENKPQQQKEQSLREREQREEEEQDQPFQKQNRNTIGWMIYRLLFWGTFSALSYNIYLVANHKQKTPVEEQKGAIPYVIDVAKSVVNQANQFIEFVTQPPSKKLLPDTIHPDLHPKTLVLNLTGTLIKTEYVFGKGQKITVRPGLQKLFRRLAQKYEIVIFAEEDEPMLMGPISKIDPKMNYLRGVLGRESMVWKDGQFIKDLRYLNRDLRKVVAVDSHPKNLKNQPKNAIIISEFDGNEKDNQLEKLTLLLDRLANVPDVRKFLESLGQNPLDTYYSRVMEAQEKMAKKAGFFGGIGGKGSKKDAKPRAQQQGF